jgi:hypothetical protein
MEWATPHEIRFFASLSMACDLEEGHFRLFPLPLFWDLHCEPSSDLSNPDFIRRARAAVMRDVRRKPHRAGRWLADSVTLPPFISNNPYPENLSEFLPERQRKLFNAIKVRDFLLIRGLSTWLRARMLAMHPMFMEEAIQTTFISMEASFRLILRRLRAQGNRNPSAKDAAALIGDVFNEPPLTGYFAEYYESRIKTVHPESRYGVFPHPPLMADDFYHLHGSLMEVYVYLLTGHVNKAYLERR